MIKWIDPKLRLPPQGKKILYFSKGDIYVVQRFSHMWLPIPFLDSEYVFSEPPELWAEFNIPNNMTGKMHIIPEGHSDMIDIDTFEKRFPNEYSEFLNAWINLIKD